MARGERRRAAKEAARQEAEDIVEYNEALRLGAALWYVILLPVRLLIRLLNPG